MAKYIKCPTCGMRSDVQFCPKCNTELFEIPVARCKKCNAPTPNPNPTFCGECGAKFKPKRYRKMAEVIVACLGIALAIFTVVKSLVLAGRYDPTGQFLRLATFTWIDYLIICGGIAGVIYLIVGSKQPPIIENKGERDALQ